MKEYTSKPNPGSAEAVKLGCTCPVIDNHYGVGIKDLPGHHGRTCFWMNERCPLHGAPKYRAEVKTITTGSDAPE